MANNPITGKFLMDADEIQVVKKAPRKFLLTVVPMRADSRRRSGKAYTETVETDHADPKVVEHVYESTHANDTTIVKVVDVREVR
jgi:hypothetical protein